MQYSELETVGTQTAIRYIFLCFTPKVIQNGLSIYTAIFLNARMTAYTSCLFALTIKALWKPSMDTFSGDPYPELPQYENRGHQSVDRYVSAFEHPVKTLQYTQGPTVSIAKAIFRTFVKCWKGRLLEICDYAFYTLSERRRGSIGKEHLAWAEGKLSSYLGKYAANMLLISFLFLSNTQK